MCRSLCPSGRRGVARRGTRFQRRGKSSRPVSRRGPARRHLHQGAEAHPQGGPMGRSIVPVCMLVLAACGSSSENLNEVEVQVINGQGISQNSNLTVRVTTPHETERKPFPFGNSANEDTWAKFHLGLIHADVVEFALETST